MTKGNDEGEVSSDFFNNLVKDMTGIIQCIAIETYDWI